MHRGGCAGCADTIDVGEASYSMVLADDMDANGQMELIVTTMNGNVYCFETQAPYDPLLAWPSQVCLISQSNHCLLRNVQEAVSASIPALPSQQSAMALTRLRKMLMYDVLSVTSVSVLQNDSLTFSRDLYSIQSIHCILTAISPLQMSRTGIVPRASGLF